jgi:fibronectin type 3 domain-containing protein
MRYVFSVFFFFGLVCALMAGCGAGSSAATTSINSNSPTPTPTPVPAHSVSISWQASSSPQVGFYNVYRSSVSGGPYSRVGWRVSGTSFTDTAVQPGTTYYYVVTSVTTSNVESTKSSEIKATVPTP